MYFILIGVVFETLFLHYQNDVLKQKIDQMETKQGLTAARLSKVARDGYRPLHLQSVNNIKRELRFRVRRSVEEKSQSVLRVLKALRFRILPLTNEETVKADRCKNVTLVCRKGERGKAGPRGLKGETGTKGDRGAYGQKGERGSAGPNGQKGQKGDSGPLGKSIEKPKFVTKFQKLITKPESSNLSLFCEAEGNPKPSMSWEFGTQKADSRYSYPAKGTLSVSNITKEDGGVIKCIAENILSKEVIETRLVVHTKPNVILPARKLTAIQGTPFEVICTADGSPFPKLEWKRGFGKLTGQQFLSGNSKNLTLKFDKPQVSDAGLYVCEADNYLGRSESSVILTIDARDCSGYKGTGKSGVYTISPDGKKSFSVFCDMQTSNGGWTVIQRRSDGSVDFSKSWAYYKLGFGSIENEFWLGNDKIHRLTKQRNMMIRFDLEDVNGNKAFAEYKMFYIDGEGDNYKAHVSGYSGTAGDSFYDSDGAQFYAKGSNRDRIFPFCIKFFQNVPWWRRRCYSRSNLNGKYLRGRRGSRFEGIYWYSFGGNRNSLKMTEMKVRPAK